MGANTETDYWALVTIIGPIILLAAMVWLVMKSKKRGAEMHQRETEEGTRRLYREEQEAHKRDPGSGL